MVSTGHELSMFVGTVTVSIKEWRCEVCDEYFWLRADYKGPARCPYSCDESIVGE